MIVWCIWISTYFVTYGVNTWLPTIFRTYYKYTIADALRNGVIINLAGLAGAFLCAMLVDHLGRRTWFILAYTLGAAPLIAIWIRGAGNPREVIVLVAISFLFISGNSMLVYLYTTEIYPTRLRKSWNGRGERMVARRLGGGTGHRRIHAVRLRGEWRVFSVWNDFSHWRGNFLWHGGDA